MRLAALAWALLAVSYALGQEASHGPLRLNQIQVIGTHNSYHAGLAPSAMTLLTRENPTAARGLDYSHPSLAAQLDGGVRQMELDVFYDPKGGRYAHPKWDAMVQQAGLPADAPYDPEHVMERPGFKVMHVQDVDQRSVCALFVECLREVRAWSDGHPGHVPVFLLIEAKEGGVDGMPQATEALPFTAEAFRALEAEILSVFPRERMVTPDDVRGGARTLPEAIAHGGWPTLDAARGKVVFLLDQRKNEPVYTAGHPALEGRVLFTNATPGAPDAAFTEENDGTAEAIRSLVRKGSLVRTRADGDTEQARTNDTRRRDEALRSGAQIVSTDYPAAEPARWTGYSAGLGSGRGTDGAAVRCDPVNTWTGCEVSR